MKNYREASLVILLFTGISFITYSQTVMHSFEEYISDRKNTLITDAKGLAQVQRFYKISSYQFKWLAKENEASLKVFMTLVSAASSFGLEENNYQYIFLQSLEKNGIAANEKDSFDAELRITIAALSFISDIAYGNSQPAFSYKGLTYTPACFDIPVLLLNALKFKALDKLTEDIEPSLPEYSAIKNTINDYLKIISDTAFREVMILSNKVNTGNKNLVIKLYQLGFLDNADKSITDSVLKLKLIEAQRQFGLIADGILRSTMLKQLNYPVTGRLQLLKLSLNYYRWLYCLTKSEAAIVVNIPAAFMKVYHKNTTILEMKMVVGKPSTPTPTLTSRVSEVILYPYWHVPFSIATKELLPRLKQNPGYIDANNYQVLNKSGNIVNPYDINWNSLSRNYFPYIIRQSTGCDNALGLLKLNFPSPFAVYLHDTPFKYAFGLNMRYMSHGCMRMEKPMELGHIILKNNAIAIDTLEQKGCLLNQSPVVVNADVNMPVIVWYNPAGIHAKGHLLFNEDVYEKFEWMKKR